LPLTLWDKTQYSATEHGTNLLRRILGQSNAFPFPKSVFAVQDCIRVANVRDGDITVDFFAGSGTTGHAIIDLNRSDYGNFKYVLIEMGEYFYTVLMPRIKKVIYSKDWREGKPVSRDGSSHMFKYVRLESYEDTLNNLELRRSQEQLTILNNHPNIKE